MSERKQADGERRSTAVTITRAAHKAMKRLALEQDRPLAALFQEAIDAYLAAQASAGR
ncbi:MAG TPA: hypothetical protein VFD84_09010 [Candidatus Binatia bacterium]|nr:hypothetical protein [Candidatus Binatia bacterium]